MILHGVLRFYDMHQYSDSFSKQLLLRTKFERLKKHTSSADVPPNQICANKLFSARCMIDSYLTSKNKKNKKIDHSNAVLPKGVVETGANTTCQAALNDPQSFSTALRHPTLYAVDAGHQPILAHLSWAVAANLISIEEMEAFCAYVFNGAIPDVVFTLRALSGQHYELPILPTEPDFTYAGLHMFDDETALGPKLPAAPPRWHAIFSPPGTGKSYSAEHELLGLAIDVDWTYSYAELIKHFSHWTDPGWLPMRISMMQDWTRKHRVDGKVLLCFGEEEALAVGARPLGVVVLDGPEWLERDFDRGRIEAGDANKAALIAYAERTGCPLIRIQTRKEYAAAVRSLLPAGTSSFTPADAKAFSRRSDAEKRNNVNILLEVARRRHNPRIMAEVVNSTVADILNPDVGEHTRSRLLLKLFPTSNHDLMSRTRMNHAATSRFITHLLKRRVLSEIDFLKTILLRTSGAGLNCFSSLLLAGTFRVPVRAWLTTLANAGTFEHGISRIAKSLKEVHNLVRRAGVVPAAWQVHPDLRYTDLMYGDQLAGRYFSYKLALDDTVESRTTPIEHTAFDGEKNSATEHTRLLWEALRKPLQSFAAGVATKMKDNQADLKSFAASFIAVGASGSASTGKSELRHVDLDVLPNKRFWLGEITTDQILSVVQRDPLTLTTCVIKTELGKLRQLLPGPIWHWLAESIVLWAGEDKLYRDSEEIMLEKTPARRMFNVLRRMADHEAATLGELVICALDYADFNITHSFNDMKGIYAAIAHVCRELAQPGDWGGTNYAGALSTIATWLVRCFESMYARAEGGDGVYHKMERGLWSGWRSTMFFNILFNYLYAEVLNMQGQAWFDGRLLSRFESMGDDVHGTSSSLVRGLMAAALLVEGRHELQGAKQLMGFRAEFLRIMYDQFGAAGSYVRSICGFCSSDLQAPEAQNGLDFVKGTSEAMHVIARRGGDVATVDDYRTPILAFFARIKDGKHNHELTNTEWLYVEEADGGYGATRFGQLPATVTNPIPWERHSGHARVKGSRGHGASALGSHVARALHSKGLDPSIASEIITRARDMVETPLAPRDVRTAWKREARYLESKHIRMLNATKPKCTRELLHPIPGLRFALTNAIGRGGHNWAEVCYRGEGAAANDHEVPTRESGYIDLEDGCERLINAALGKASIAPYVLRELRDLHGRRLPVHEALARLTPPSMAGLRAALVQAWPEWWVTAVLDGRVHDYRNTAGVIAGEFQPLVSYAHYWVIHNTALLPKGGITQGELLHVLRRVNQTIIQWSFDTNFHLHYGM
nr:putative RNA-dependent RNA polymerase [Rhizoctonia fumigata mycovirus]